MLISIYRDITCVIKYLRLSVACAISIKIRNFTRSSNYSNIYDNIKC